MFKNRKFSSVWPVIPLVIVLIFTFRNAKWARHTWEGDPVVQKEAGLYLRAHFPQDTRILTIGPHAPYYFYDGDPFVHSLQKIPWAPYEEVMAYALEKNIDLLVLPEWILVAGDYPIKNLTSENAGANDLELVAVVGKEKPFRIWIYRVLKSTSASYHHSRLTFFERKNILLTDLRSCSPPGTWRGSSVGRARD